MSTPLESIPLESAPSENSKQALWLILAAVVAGIILLVACRDTTPNITGITVEQAKKRLKDTGYTVGEKIGFIEPTDGNQLGKIAEQEVDKQAKKIHYKMYQIDVNNIDEYARIAKEKAKQALRLQQMQHELEKAMRETPVVAAPEPTPEPVIEPVIEAPPPPPPVQEMPRKKKLVDMGFGSTGLSVRNKRESKEGFFW